MQADQRWTRLPWYTSISVWYLTMLMSLSSWSRSSSISFVLYSPKCCYQLHIHCSLSVVTHAPFHASMLRPASQAGPMHEATRVGKLVNAALLSLINEACVNVCCATLLSSELVCPLVCRHDRVTQEAGRVGLVGMDRGRRGYWVMLYLYIFILPGF